MVLPLHTIAAVCSFVTNIDSSLFFTLWQAWLEPQK